MVIVLFLKSTLIWRKPRFMCTSTATCQSITSMNAGVRWPWPRRSGHPPCWMRPGRLQRFCGLFRQQMQISIGPDNSYRTWQVTTVE
eukprot:SM000316S12302  [mRNA]  locus=s316:111636:112024:- [translate_table: standard]